MSSVAARPCINVTGVDSVPQKVSAKPTQVERAERAIALQHAIFHSVSFSEIATDEQGVIQIFNVGAERMLGYSAAEMVNTITPAEISDPTELIARAEAMSAEFGCLITPGFHALAFKAARGLEDIYELTYVCKDGSRLPAVVSVTALRDTENTIIGYLLIGTDNTARKRIEAERQQLLDQQAEMYRRLADANVTLRNSEQKLAVTLDAIGDGVIATDAEACITLINPVAEQLTGWSHLEALGLPIASVFKIIREETRLPATIPVLMTLASGSLQAMANHTILVARDGTERAISDSCAPIRNRDEQVIGAVMVFRDVSGKHTAEQSLRDSTALMQTVLSTVADGIITMHAQGGVVETANQAAERMFGYLTAELIGVHVGLLIPELDGDGVEGALAHYNASDTARTSGLRREVVGRHKDGHDFPIDMAVSEMMLRGQRYFSGILRDISARRQAEDDLVQAGALQNAIFNSANFSSIATDASGVIQIFNVGAERMLGYSAVEVVNTLTPADISDADEVGARATALSLELGTPIAPGFDALVFKASRGIEDIYELTYVRKDGSRVPAVVSVTALRDPQESIIGYLLIGTDNTARKLLDAEQKKLDQRLRDQQFYTRSLIESNIDALMTTDPSGIISDVNKQMEALTGCTRDELIGAPFKDYFTDPVRAEAGIRRVLSEKKVTDYELTAHARDGKKTVVSYNATTFYDRNRVLQGVFASARDVTERNRVEEELQLAKAAAESASRTKSDFLASMSHEIRTPMNAIMGIADLLAKTPLNTEQDEYVRIFRRAGDNLLNLINDILDLSKVEASQLEIERTGFSLSEVLEKVNEMVAVKSREKGLSLIFEIASDVPTDLIGDPSRLQQILLNLLGNAIKFTETGEVSLRVTQDATASLPTALRFTVSDTGIGIAAPKLDHIFERFTQADSSTTRRFGGSGLGLTISKRLAELMGGRIEAASTLDVGSVFSVVVPFERGSATMRRVATRVGAHESTPLPPLRILLAEDSPDNCTIVRAYLAHAPYTIDVAETGVLACDMFEATHYDLVLMDRQMPVMDGLTATRRIRAWEAANGRASTPIIAVTASALKGDREKCMAAGCTAFLTKPIRQDVLLQAILECHVASRIAPAPVAGDSSVGKSGGAAELTQKAGPAHRDDAAPVAAGRSIVLVEDNDDLRELLTLVLELSGHTVSAARDGTEGLARIIAGKPEVAIVDIGLSGLDGYEIARRVRAALGDSVLLVATTGYGQESDRLSALAAGFDLHFVKPLDFATLERALQRQ